MSIDADIRPGMVSLPDAVSLAHRALFAETIQLSGEAIDIIATTLSRHLAIYRLQNQPRQLVRIPPIQLAAGRFVRAAQQFETGNGEPPITDLAVVKAELDRVLAAWTPQRLKGKNTSA